jgi:hypothetical protein
LTSVVLPIPRWQAADGCSGERGERAPASVEMMRPQVLSEQLTKF